MDAHVPTRKKHKITPAREKRLTSFDGKTCSLAWVLLMPLDIIFEVFGYLNPSDLLGLARMTKSLRRVLMHKSSMSVWKTARSNVPGLPDAPPGMSEPAWANLVFDRHCHYCLAKGVRKIHWRLRVRLCKPCSEKHIVKVKCRGPNGFRAGLSWEVTSHVFTLLVSIIPAQYTGAHFYYLEKDYQTANIAFWNMDPSEHAEFISENEERVKQIDQHAALCEAWANIHSQKQIEELKDHRVTRLQHIKQKLKALGYDIDSTVAHDTQAFDKLPLVRRNEVLTQRVWRRIKQPLLDYLEDEKSRRLATKHKAIPVIRKRFAIAVMRRFRDFTTLHHDSLGTPNFPETSSLIHSIIRSPIPVEIPESALVGTQAVDILHGLFDEWRLTVQDRLLSLVACLAQASDASAFRGDQWKTSEPAQQELLHRLALAKTVFTCECSHVDVFRGLGSGDSEKPSTSERRTIKPLFYPDVLGHICLARTPKLDTIWTVSSLLLDSFRSSRGYPSPQSWDCSSLRVKPSLGEVVQRVILAAHLDPETATVPELDRLDVHFACMNCAVQDEDEMEVYETEAFRWRDAVRHDHITHASGDRDVVWQVLTAHQVEEGDQDGGWPPADWEIWICLLCDRFLPELMDLGRIEQHLKDEHTILEPIADRDYTKDFSAPECGYEAIPQGVRVCLAYAGQNLRKV